jgi:uncharacterized protein
MRMRHAVAVLFSLVLVCGPARAEDLTAEKKHDIEHLLAMTGALQLGKQFATSFVSAITQDLRKSRPDIPQGTLDQLPAEVGAVFEENAGLLKEMFVPLYHKYFTGAEVKEMIRFYATPLGQKTIRIMPALLQDSFSLGQLWAQRLQPQLRERVTGKLRQQGVKI